MSTIQKWREQFRLVDCSFGTSKVLFFNSKKNYICRWLGAPCKVLEQASAGYTAAERERVRLERRMAAKKLERAPRHERSDGAALHFNYSSLQLSVHNHFVYFIETS